MSSIWGIFSGSSKSSSPSNDTPSQQSTSFTPDTAQTYQPPPFSPTAADSQADFLQYADPNALHPLAGLNRETLDYLTLEEAALSPLHTSSNSLFPSRGWGDDLCYGTGVTYLTALSTGGLWGLSEGLRRTTAVDAPRLRLNAVLNGVTRRGPFLGNSAGVMALIYNIVNSTVGSIRGVSDGYNSVASGFVAGAVFKSTRGLRAVGISGGLVAGVAGAWTMFKNYMATDSG